MARMIPNRIKTNNLAEVAIYDAIKSSKLASDWTVIHSQGISKPFLKSDEEIDFIVFIPQQGIVVIEAKGATAARLDESGWYLEKVPEPEKDPIKQLIGAENNLRRELRNIDIDDRTVPLARILWLPKVNVEQSEIDPARTGRSFRPYEIAFENDLDNPYQTIVGAMAGSIEDRKYSKSDKANPDAFTSDQITAIVTYLTGSFKASRTVQEKHRERERELKKANEEQVRLLNLLRDNEIIYFSGPAGSGKSKMLAQLAMDNLRRGHKVLVTCHNIMMADWMDKDLGEHDGLTTSNFDDLLLEIAGQKEHKTTDPSKWYNETLPTAALDALRKGSEEFKYSTIVIDEFQDIAINPLKLEVIAELRGKKPGLSSRIYLAGDDDQQIMNGAMPVSSVDVARETFGPLTHIQLNKNLRQTPALSNAIYSLLGRTSPFEEHLVSEDLDDQLEIINVTEENQAKRLSMVLQRLEKDYRLEDIRVLHFDNEEAVLTKVFANRGNLDSKGERWLAENCKHSTNQAGQIKWRSIRKFKGLDEDAIVLTDISRKSAEWVEKELKRALDDALYVGLTRARFKVVMLVQDELYPASHNADGSIFKNNDKA